MADASDYAAALLGYNGPDNPQFIPPEQQQAASAAQFVRALAARHVPYGDQTYYNEQVPANPEAVAGFLGTLGHGVATTPTAQAITSGLTLPADVYAGRQPMGLPSQTEDLSRVADMTGLAMTGGLGGVASGAVPKEAVGIFGGRLAKTADHAALAQAEEMAAKGAPHSDIWTQTGWFQGADGKWRFEIPDNTSYIGAKATEKLSENLPGEVSQSKMAGALWHEPLYDAYPQLRANDVQMEKGGGYPFTPSGSWSPRISRIDVTADTPAQARDVLLHEAQHSVQDIEGFAKGASPSDRGLIRDVDAAQAINATYRPELDRLAKEGKWDEYAALDQKRRDHIEPILAEGPMYGYRRAGGEVEARNVQARRDLTPAERIARPPWETQDVPDIRFDPANEGSGFLLGSTSTDRKSAGLLGQALLGAKAQ